MPNLTLQCPKTSDTGAYRLSWNGLEGATFRLIENDEILYEGSELATTVSGRSEGNYVYRLGEVREGGEVTVWSESCRVSVTPPSIQLAFGLFGLGFVVFLAVLIVIIRGHRVYSGGLST